MLCGDRTCWWVHRDAHCGCPHFLDTKIVPRSESHAIGVRFRSWSGLCSSQQPRKLKPERPLSLGGVYCFILFWLFWDKSDSSRFQQIPACPKWNPIFFLEHSKTLADFPWLWGEDQLEGHEERVPKALWIFSHRALAELAKIYGLVDSIPFRWIDLRENLQENPHMKNGEIDGFRLRVWPLG